MVQKNDGLIPTAARREQFLADLKKTISDPIHLRIIESYRRQPSVESMEMELGAVLVEILERAD
jgi:hypothetical protein